MNYIKEIFKNFYSHFNYLETEQVLKYFAFFGGAESKLESDFFDDLDTLILHNITLGSRRLEETITPSYLLESPYRTLLIAVARGDGKLLNVYKRARVGESVGSSIVTELCDLSILVREVSREAPLKTHPKQKIKKHLRSYRIQSKVRFREPFMRFWFGFVEPYKRELREGKTERFLHYYEQHSDRCASLTFEQLSNTLLEVHFEQKDPLQNKGSYWDQHSEFDVLAKTKGGKTILGECKYKGRKVCKSELTKLKEKAERSSIEVDYYALFSSGGFSNELLQNMDDDLLLFEAKDFDRLL